ncbi:hypothetical protein BZY71_24700 [Leclercia adecarboxylata]|nr:hypothetical protein BZY71_24700 [Leclercia adecarboxylata]
MKCKPRAAISNMEKLKPLAPFFRLHDLVITAGKGASGPQSALILTGRGGHQAKLCEQLAGKHLPGEKIEISCCREQRQIVEQRLFTLVFILTQTF